MTLKFTLITFLCLCVSYSMYAYYYYMETGGFIKNSAEYNGYRYFKDNNIVNLTSCKVVNKEFGEEASKEWMTGCNKYLEMNK